MKRGSQRSQCSKRSKHSKRSKRQKNRLARNGSMLDPGAEGAGAGEVLAPLQPSEMATLLLRARDHLAGIWTRSMGAAAC